MRQTLREKRKRLATQEIVELSLLGSEKVIKRVGKSRVITVKRLDRLTFGSKEELMT